MNEDIQGMIRKLEHEEYYAKLKKRGVNAEFKKSEQEKLLNLAKEDPLVATRYGTRSKRLTRGEFASEKPETKRS